MSNRVNVRQGATPSPDSRFAAAHPPRPDHEEILARVLARWGRFVSQESVERAMRSTLREGDVVVATHSKAGTTLGQQIIHQLRSMGSMDFDEISAAVPWMEVAADLGLE